MKTEDQVTKYDQEFGRGIEPSWVGTAGLESGGDRELLPSCGLLCNYTQLLQRL